MQGMSEGARNIFVRHLTPKKVRMKNEPERCDLRTNPEICTRYMFSVLPRLFSLGFRDPPPTPYPLPLSSARAGGLSHQVNEMTKKKEKAFLFIRPVIAAPRF